MQIDLMKHSASVGLENGSVQMKPYASTRFLSVLMRPGVVSVPTVQRETLVIAAAGGNVWMGTKRLEVSEICSHETLLRLQRIAINLMFPSSGQCMPVAKVCDGRNDVEGGADELNCENYNCPPGFWKCANEKECIPVENVCDGNSYYWMSSCSDSSDEANCGEWNCTKGWWKCANNLCIEEKTVCDGRSQCRDSSDEDNCDNWVCSPGFWKCQNNLCKMLGVVCNGANDCGDNSDEMNCESWTCPEDKWKCHDSVCINLKSVCDGTADCRDGSDEILEFCREWVCADYEGRHYKLKYFKCADGIQCVDAINICDAYGTKNCFDGSDELNCETVAPPPGYIKCGDMRTNVQV